MMKKILSTLFIFLILFNIKSFAISKNVWIDQQMERLTVDQKISMLLWNVVSDSSKTNENLIHKINDKLIGNVFINFKDFKTSADFVKRLTTDSLVLPFFACDIDNLQASFINNLTMPYLNDMSLMRSEVVKKLGKIYLDKIINSGFSAFTTCINYDKDSPFKNYILTEDLFKAFINKLSGISYMKKYFFKTDTLLVNTYRMDGFIYSYNKDSCKSQLKSYVLTFGDTSIILPFDDVEARDIIKQSIAEKNITEIQISKKCRELFSKRLSRQSSKIKPLSKFIVSSIIRNAINSVPVLLKNKDNFIPIVELENKNIVSLSISNRNSLDVFNKYLNKFSKVKNIKISSKISKQQVDLLIEQLKSYNVIILGIERFIKNTYLYDELKKIDNLIWCNFNDSLSVNLDKLSSSRSIISVSSCSDVYQKVVAQIIFGAVGSTGILTEKLSRIYLKGTGIKTKSINNFSFGVPEEVGMNSEYLETKIDSIANYSILKKAFPGCQILIAKDNKIIFHKCYGYHTYFNAKKVRQGDIYDLASITKIIASTSALMKLVDEKKIDLDEKFSTYWSDFEGTNKENIILRNVLAHFARLKPYIQFWKETINEEGYFKNFTFEYQKSWFHEIEVSKNMYLYNGYRSDFYDKIADTKLQEKLEYKYSGLSFILYPEIVEDITDEKFDVFLNNVFYKPLGASSLMFNPHNKISLDRVIPTENDDWFRNTLIKGYVHDEGCAMLGGISGNAGLFSNAIDLGKMMQMFLNKGAFGGRRYLSKKTVTEFTRCQFPEAGNRRGLGFDKPLLGNDTLSIEDAYPAPSVSKDSFGHSGYTGTFTWVDPKNNLLYIFLSNRVHPTRNNKVIYKLNTRIKIHQAIYDSLKK